MGFFNPAVLTLGKVAVSKVPKCGACGLYRNCLSPKMPVSGQGRRKILLVGESPGKVEDEKGIPFEGPAGQKLQAHLREAGISDMRKECWITNALICRPGSDNKIPKPEQRYIEYCRPNLFNAIEKFKPDVILCFGGVAIKSLIGHVWKEDVGPVSRWVGFQIPSQKPNAWLCPMYHPSYLLRQEDPVLELHFQKHLKAALELDGKPWLELPQYGKRIECIISPTEAAGRLKQLLASSPKLIAFDYETDRLKPDHQDSRIVCCSISDGKVSIAYPWHGPTINMTRQFLMDETIGKVASNMKFEQRWTMKEFGKEVRNWAWDTMQAAHVLDNRRGITGLKFQSYVNFGQPAYEEHIAPFMKSNGSNLPNRVKEVDLMSLLLYCGMDSLLEFKLAKKQMKEMGCEKV